MIVSEHYATRTDGVELFRTHSDAGLYIERDGVQYVDAVDPVGEHRSYTETDIPIEPDSDEAQPSDYEAALGEMGVETP